MQFSIVIPVFNEGEVISKNLGVIIDSLPQCHDEEFEIIMVDDGSSDDTITEIQRMCEQKTFIKCVSFTRNFGKEAAMLAGLRYALGEAVIVMDSDLQHPPSLIGEMLEIWERGDKVVHGCKKTRGSESFLYKYSSTLFYFLFKKMTRIDMRGHSDFKLLDRDVVDAYCNLPEKGRFFRAAIPYLGFSSKAVYFDVEDRVGGESSWTLGNLVRYSIDGIANFTSLPLHLISFASIAVFSVSIVMAVFALVQYLSGTAVEGFTTVIILLMFIGSLIMFSLGQIGIYLEKIFDEVKSRPNYIIDNTQSINLEVNQVND